MDGIRVYFHGRPQGQSIWGVKDGDIAGSYLEQFLNWTYGKDLSACMIIDHWNGDTYYSYIHRKDISEKSGRQDAYCAITLRFVHNECYNVATLYELLKAAYEQLVGKAVHIDKGLETFLITKFSDIQVHLFGISETVLVNFKSFDKLKNSIFPLRETKNTNDKVVSYALQEVDSPAFREDAKQNRILVSEFLMPKMNFLKGQVDKLRTEKENLQTQLVNISDKIANQYDEQLRVKDEEIEQLKQELECERNKNSYDYERKKKFNLSNIKDINLIIETARQMASRFPEENKEGVKDSMPSKQKGSSFVISEVWYRWIVLVFLILLLICSMALLVNINKGFKPQTNNPTGHIGVVQSNDSSSTNTTSQFSVDRNSNEGNDSTGQNVNNETDNCTTKVNDSDKRHSTNGVGVARNSNKGTDTKGTGATKGSGNETVKKIKSTAKVSKNKAIKNASAAETSEKEIEKNGAGTTKAVGSSKDETSSPQPN